MILSILIFRKEKVVTSGRPQGRVLKTRLTRTPIGELWERELKKRSGKRVGKGVPEGPQPVPVAWSKDQGVVPAAQY